MFSSLGSRAKAALLQFRSRTDGNVAVLFGLASVALFIAVGGGVEIARAYNASQKLNQAADLACQYASRPSQVQLATSSPSTYSANVKQYIATSLGSQKFGFTQKNATPFTFTANGPANVTLSSDVTTIFGGLVKVSTIPITVTVHCYDTPSTVPQRVPNNNSNLITQEGFENTAVCPTSGYCFVSANGSVGTNGQTNGNGSNGTTSTPSTSPSLTASYTGSGGAVWYVTGYCVEVDHSGVIKTTVPEGFYSAELDCDNGSGSAGNSSISTKVYLPAGSYELRYNYASRVGYPNYDPAYICGTTAGDVSWANDRNSVGSPVTNALRSNQINAYLDPDTTGSAPTHLTLDGQRLAGANLIDVCVYSRNWIERSVRINVSTAGYFWLSFAADGQNDSYGGQIDDIRLCNGTCTDSLQDSFPSAWLSSSTLFEDTFDSPSYANGSVYATNGNLNVSFGTSGTSASGWPSLAASGWSTGSYNQAAYIFASSATPSAQGGQSVMLDGGNPSPTNRLTSRPFLLDPGYYRVDYYYIANAIFSSNPATYCASSPTAAAAAAANRTGTGNASVRFYSSTTGTVGNDTNIVGVFMSHAQLASTPIGGGALNSQTSFNNPDGTTSTTPTVSPAAVSLSSYNVNQVNPLIDICTYANSWQSRTAYIQITKPAYYWLTFAALGSAEGVGGGIDDVRLTALGSLYSTAPAAYTTIPVPSPQPGSTYTNGGQFSGFSVVADPQTAPAS